MASFAIDPSDDLYAEQATGLPSNSVRASAKSGISLGTIAIGLAVAGGMAGLAELWTGAISDMVSSQRSKSEIVMGPVADMPEIKNGVVAVGSAPPVRVIPGPAPSIAASPAPQSLARASETKAAPAPAPAAMASVAAPAIVPSAKPVAALRAPADKGPVATGSTSPATPVAVSAAVPRPLAAVPAPAIVAPRSLAAAPAPSAAPLPPTRTASRATGNVLASVVTQPPVTAPPAMSPPAPLPPVRSAQRKPDAAAPAQRVASARPSTADAAATDAQERSLLGIPVPGFVPSGNDIKSGFDSIGDAVMSLPKRF